LIVDREKWEAGGCEFFRIRIHFAKPSSKLGLESGHDGEKISIAAFESLKTRDEIGVVDRDGPSHTKRKITDFR
jgi:hypothetical protein